MNLRPYILKIPIGYSAGVFQDKKYGITFTEFNGGKSIKIYAEELAGTHFISLNYYCLSSGDLLKPCEMPAETVIEFLKNVKILSDE